MDLLAHDINVTFLWENKVVRHNDPVIIHLSFLTSTREEMLIIFNVLLLFATNINSLDPAGYQDHLFKCCPLGKYVGRRKFCITYDEELSFSKIPVYDEQMRRTNKSLEDVFSLTPGKFKDSLFKSEVLDITMLDFNIYVTQVSYLLIMYIALNRRKKLPNLLQVLVLLLTRILGVRIPDRAKCFAFFHQKLLSAH